jgi:hypothetical protein
MNVFLGLCTRTHPLVKEYCSEERVASPGALAIAVYSCSRRNRSESTLRERRKPCLGRSTPQHPCRKPYCSNPMMFGRKPRDCFNHSSEALQRKDQARKRSEFRRVVWPPAAGLTKPYPWYSADGTIVVRMNVAPKMYPI